MQNRLLFILLFSMCVIAFSSCGNGASDGENNLIVTDVELDAEESRISRETEDKPGAFASYNDERKMFGLVNIPSFDGNYIYGSKYCKYSIIDGKKQINCNKAGCSHKNMSCEAYMFENVREYICYEGGLLFTTENELCFFRF